MKLMSDKRSVDTRCYDWKLAAIQAKRIYKKLLKLHEEAKELKVIPPDEIMTAINSFDFLIDIIHLMDPDDKGPKKEDIDLINVYRVKPGKEG